METLVQKMDYKKGLSFFFLSVFFILFFQVCRYFYPSISLSEALYISDPNKSIMDEMKSIPPGELIILGRGIYQEAYLEIPKGVSLIGEDLGSVIISGDPNIPLDAVIIVSSQSVIKNLVICNGGVGIFVLDEEESPGDITIENNLIINNENGILFAGEKGSRSIKIIGNTIVNNKDSGIVISVNPNQPDLLCRDNIIAYNGGNGIVNNGKGVGIDFVQRDSSQTEFTDFIDLTHIFLSYNNIYDNDIYRIWLYSDNNIRDSKIIPNLNHLGKGNFSKDPFFLDANKGNYHLDSYSPCIDQGDPNSDFSQEPDNNGGRVNLGFFGNSPQATPTLDTDKDGILDYQEGPGDMDEDGFSDWNDVDTIIFPLTQEIDKIAVHFEGIIRDGNQKTRFEEAKIIPSKGLSTNPPGGILPFDVIQYHIVNPSESDAVKIRMILPKDKIGKSYRALIMDHHIRYMSLSLHLEWESIPFEMDTNILDDPNKTSIIFRIEDGGIGDEDGTKNDVIEHTGALVIKPQPLTEWKDKQGCFIAVIIH